MVNPEEIDWKGLKKDLEMQEMQDIDDRLEKWLFLGTIMSLSPSGKYYTVNNPTQTRHRESNFSQHLL